MSSNLTLEQFVNSIRNLYSSSSTTSSGSSNQAQTSEQSNQTSKMSMASYSEILNVINSNLEALTDNAANLIDNVLPVFVLPEFTLPNMAVLYAVISQLQQQSSNGQQQQQQHALNINQEKLLNEIENCIRLADERQVNRLD